MPRLTKVIKDLLACGKRARFARFELVVVRRSRGIKQAFETDDLIEFPL